MKAGFKLYLELFKICTAQRNLETGQMVLSHFLHSKFQHHIYLQNAGINMCVKCEDLELARKVFDGMRERDIFSYTMLISGYSQISKFKEALRLLIDFMKMGLQLDEIIFSSSLKSAAGMQSDAIGSGIHGTCIKYGFGNDVHVANALLNMYGKTGSIKDAEKVFHRLVEKDIATWNSMINAYEHHGLNQEAIDLFQEMCAIGLQPSEVTLSSAVILAAGVQSDVMGRKIHGTCIKYGCLKNVCVGSALVDMYGKAGSIGDAEKIFLRMVKKNVISWSSVINAYEHHGLIQEAVDLFEEMFVVGLLPNEITFLSALKSAAGMQSDAVGRKFHGTCIKYGCNNNVRVANVLLNMYGETGSIEDTEKVFHRLVEKNVVSWSSMINAYEHHGLNQEAVDLFEEMCAAGLLPNEITFLSVLKSAAGIQGDAIGGKIHGTCIKYGCQKNMLVGNALLAMYIKAGSIEDAEKIFHRMVKKDIVSWNSMINAYENNGLNKEAVNIFHEMCAVGLQPDEITLMSALKSAAGMQSDAVGRKFHGTCIKYGCNNNVRVANALLNMYGKTGSIEDAKKVFHRLVEKNFVSWSSMINAYEHHGLNQEAVYLFEEMCVVGLLPNEITFLSALKSAAGIQSDAIGRKIHGTCIKYGFQKNMLVGNALVDMYNKAGSIEDAEKIFHRMVKKDVVSWNSVINAFENNGLNQEAVDLFHEMRAVGLQPDRITLLSAVNSAAGMRSDAVGRKFHGTCIKYDCQKNMFVGSALLNMYGKTGSIEDAEKVFHQLVEKDVISWSSMINAYEHHGLNHEAIDLFEEMCAVGLLPNEITFLSVLKACSHAGLVEKGFYYLELMRKFKLQPKYRHCTLIVDTLG